MFKTKMEFEYDPRTFMWTVTVKEKDADHPFVDGKKGSGKHWLVPAAMIIAMGEYYGLDNYFTRS